MGGSSRVCLGALLVAALLLSSARGASVSRLDVELRHDTDLLALGCSTVFSSNGGASSKTIRRKYQVVQVGFADSLHAEYIHAYNPPLSADLPAIISYQDYTTRTVIDDNPLWLTISDFMLVDLPAGGKLATAAGYRNDSAFVVSFVPGNDTVSWLYLTSGVDHTGNGHWEPEVYWCGTNDYNADGRPDVFCYVNALRDLRPRELFCLDAESLTVEWSIPLAPSIIAASLYPTGDSTDPGVIFVSYNPKQGVADSVFSDSWGYLTEVDTAGHIRFNRIVAAEHGGMFLYPAHRPGRFYLGHTVPLTDPTDTLAFPPRRYYLSKITTDGAVIAQTTLSSYIVSMWPAADLGEPGSDMFVLDGGGQITRFTSDLRPLARSGKTRLLGYLGPLDLRIGDQRALVFRTAGGAVFLDPSFRQIGFSAQSGSVMEPLSYDSGGHLNELLFAGSNRGAVVSIFRRSTWRKAQALVIRYHLYLLVLAIALLIALVAINQRRYRAVQRLRRREADYHAFVAASPDLVLRLDRNGVVLNYEARHLDLLAMPPTAFMHRAVGDFLPPDVARATLDQIGRALASGKMQTLEYELEIKGQTRAFEARVAAVNEQEVIAVVRDITARTRAQQALRYSEERFRSLVANIPGVIYRGAFDDDRTLDFISEEIEHICGYPAVDFIDNSVRSLTSLIHPDDRAMVQAALAEGVGRRQPYIIEYRIIDSHGNVHWVYDKGQAVFANDRQDNPTVLWLDGAIFDVTEQKTAGEALRASEEKLRAQYKGNPVPTYTWQHTGDDFVLIDYNDAALDITEGGITRFVGTAAGVMYRDFPEILADLDRCFREQTIVQRDMVYEFVTTRRVTDLSIRYVYVPPNLVMVHTEDVTERKRSRQQLNQRLRYEEGLSACSATLLASPASAGTIDSALETLLAATGLCRVYLFENFQDPELGLCGRMTHEVCRAGVESELDKPLYQRFAYIPDRIAERDRLASGRHVAVLAREASSEARRVMQEQGVRSCLLLPVFVGGEWTGFVGFDDTREDRLWDQQDIRLLRTAAEMLGSYLAIVETQRRLVEERDFNQSILQTANSLIVCLDGRGRITVFNDELERVTGYTRQEVLGKKWLDLFVPKRYHHRGLSDFARWVRENPQDRYEQELITRTGEERVVLWSNSMMINPHSGALTAIAIGHDTTDRRLAEAAVHEAAEKYRAVMEQSSDIIFLVDVSTGHVIEANVAMQKLLGYSAEEITDLTIYDFIAHDRSDVENNMRQVLSEGLSFMPERYYRCRDGRLVPVEVVVNSIEYKGRQVLCAVARDTTQRRRAEQALREQEEKYRLLVENVRASIALIDNEGRFLFINETGAAYHRGIPADVTGKTVWELFPSEIADLHMAQIRRVIDTESELEEEAHTFLDGKWRWFHINLQPFPDNHGRVAAALVIAHDITASKEAEQALSDSEQRFRELADLLPQTLFELDIDGFITYTNRHGLEASGYTADDLKAGLHLEALLVESDRADALENFRQRLHGNPAMRTEYRLRRKDGSSFPALVYSAPIVRAGETVGMRGVAVDITDQKLAEERFRRAQRANYEQMKEIAGGVSHEIYNSLYPAAVAIEKIRLMMSEAGLDDLSRLERLISLTEKAVRRAIDMTESVTRYSRLEAEKQDELVSLRTLFDEILETNQLRLESLKVSLRDEVAADLKATLSKGHAYSLFNNLVVNALDALSEAQQRELRIAGRADDGWVRVEIADSGPGIPADARDKVFVPFYSTKPNRGAGLGLAMARKLVEMYGGSIRVESDLDNLTTFVILLPQPKIQ